VRLTTLLILLFFSNSSFASLVTYDNLTDLENASSNLIVEDWRSYDLHTVLSNTSRNGIIYPTQPSDSEPLVTLGPNCRKNEFWCISYLTDEGRTRSFGRAPITFGFEQDIDSFSLSLIQGINEKLDGISSWDVTFDTGAVVSLESIYTVDDSDGFAYIGLTGLNGVRSFTINTTRNDSGVVWSFNHIGYQVQSVSAPSLMVLFLMGILYCIRRRY
jgi:hypothetical protein